MVVAGGDGCQRGGRARRAKQDPGQCRPGSCKGIGLSKRGGGTKGIRGESGGNQGKSGLGAEGGAAGGLSRRPCGHCINEGGVWAGRCLVCFGHYVVGRRGGRWSLPGATSPRLEIPCGLEEVCPAQCGCVSVCCRCSRIASAVRAVALARRPLPRIHRPCPSPQGGTGGGPGAAGERDATRPPYPRGDSRSSLAARNVPGRTWGLPSKRFALPLPLADAGGGGPPRPAGRGGQGDQARACTL